MAFVSTNESCESEGAVAIALKRYGWRDRYCGFGAFKVGKSDPIVRIAKLLPCSNENCYKVETMPNEFKSCINCLTLYCSKECQKCDWTTHRSFCKSDEAYYSQLNAWPHGARLGWDLSHQSKILYQNR